MKETIVLNDLQKKILAEFKEYQCEEDGEGGFRLKDDEFTPLLIYSHLEQELKIPKSRLQIEVRELRNLGILRLSPAVDCDYVPNGSGWTLTKLGLETIDNPSK